MKPMKMLRAVFAGAALSFLASSAQATLFDRGAGLIYDDVFNVTWLQDPYYARTSGYDADGKMGWAQAKQWVDGLSYHDSVRGVDYSDWRLPQMHPFPAQCNDSYNGGQCGLNVSPASSELAYMYYVTFGNISPFDSRGQQLPYGTPWGLVDDPAQPGDESMFVHLPYGGGTANSAFWMDGAYSQSFAWFFDLSNGYQGVTYKTFDYLVPWAVRDGDVAAVSAELPEPSTLALSALLLAGVVHGRRRARAD
ncbi:PEP-CTERM sorting domain-containing protein [Uliginosibacterium sp. H3]|uniref:PEP-CTERM sorting domain-containing protein n=1 Tax=Uliginosibacterium silvisoli TaxID=3114758 RepID=A0ABU6JZ46_9RHOO|nr:PEP-CTERM sorting domain-containing protein [Uliginosibacterium sp. H3]